GVRGRLARTIRDQAARAAPFHLALPFTPAQEERVEQPRAFRLGQEFVSEPDQPARGDFKLHAHAPVAMVDHLGHRPFAAAHRVWAYSYDLFGPVAPRQLYRLMRLAVNFARDDLRARDVQLKAFAPHLLDQDRELQLAAARDLETVRRVGLFDADRDVAERLLIEPRANLA